MSLNNFLASICMKLEILVRMRSNRCIFAPVQENPDDFTIDDSSF